MTILKNIKGTEHHHPHTEIWIDGQYIGYITKNTSRFARVGENWNFTSECKIESCFDKTKKALINKVEQTFGYLQK